MMRAAPRQEVAARYFFCSGFHYLCHMKPIFLIGYMGSGKTTLGRALSQATGMQFIDLDEYIENRYHMSISEIFSCHGEADSASASRQCLQK